MTEHSDNLSIRTSELKAQTRFATERLAMLMEKVPSFVSLKNVDQIQETIDVIKFQARIATDNQWVIALFDAGISPDKICQIWDLKDNEARVVKTDS